MNGAPFSSNRLGRAAAFAEFGALDVDGRGKDDAGIDGRDVGRRQYPLQAGFVAPHFACPAFHLDDLEIAADAEMFVEHSSEFADRHTVPRRQFELADE